jgi:hypothetical protein
MASKFSDFIESNKLDPRRLMAASRKIEQLRPEDRALKLAKSKGDEAAKAKKPRSGRAITPRLLASVAAGKTISGPAKARLLRAVNRVLEQKKKDAVESSALF